MYRALCDGEKTAGVVAVEGGPDGEEETTMKGSSPLGADGRGEETWL